MFRLIRRWARVMKKDGLMLWFACRDPRTPVWIKALAAGLVCYAFSPIDLIPDVIPVVGLLDDAVIVPSGIMLLLRLLPQQVRLASQQKATQQSTNRKKITRWTGLILLIWAGIIVFLIGHYSA